MGSSEELVQAVTTFTVELRSEKVIRENKLKGSLKKVERRMVEKNYG